MAFKLGKKPGQDQPVVTGLRRSETDLPKDGGPIRGMPQPEPQRGDIYEQTRRELLTDFIHDMEDSAIDGAISEEQLLAAEKRHKQMKMKKNAMFWGVMAACATVILLGVYKTFFEHQLTYREIAYISNYYNGRTNFPQEGVQGYLDTNACNLIQARMTAGEGVGMLSVRDPVLSKISVKSDLYANVYFYVTVETNNGESRVDCILPLYWNDIDWQYRLAGNVIFTASNPVDSSVEVVQNPFMGFEGMTKADAATIASSESFVDNFFSFFYAGRDVSPYYDGDPLNTGDLQYVDMRDWSVYTSMNGNGYNALAVIRVKTGSGMIYETEKLLWIEPSGNSWVIHGIL